MMALRFVCALIALFVAPCVDAFWRMECRARSGLGRLDPLMSPGEVSQHVHYIHGSSGKLLLHDITFSLRSARAL